MSDFFESDEFGGPQPGENPLSFQAGQRWLFDSESEALDDRWTILAKESSGHYLVWISFRLQEDPSEGPAFRLSPANLFVQCDHGIVFAADEETLLSGDPTLESSGSDLPVDLLDPELAALVVEIKRQNKAPLDGFLYTAQFILRVKDIQQVQLGEELPEYAVDEDPSDTDRDAETDSDTARGMNPAAASAIEDPLLSLVATIENHDAEAFERITEEQPWVLEAHNGTIIGTTRYPGDRPLHYAVRHGFEDGMRILLELGVDVNAMGDTEYTPLHYAVLSEEVDSVCAMLAHGADGEAMTADGQTPMTLAAALCEQNEIVQLLVAAGVPMDLNSAIRIGPIPDALASLRRSEDPLRDASDPIRLILDAIDHIHYRLSLEESDESIVREATQLIDALLELGCDPNSGDTHPLFYAVQMSEPAIAEHLLKSGSDPRHPKLYDESLLELAENSSAAADMKAMLLRFGVL